MSLRHPYGALGLEDVPALAFAGIRALRQIADTSTSQTIALVYRRVATFRAR